MSQHPTLVSAEQLLFLIHNTPNLKLPLSSSSKNLHFRTQNTIQELQRAISNFDGDSESNQK